MKKLLLFSLAAAAASLARGDVREVFAQPPPEARLQMWYHWVADCVTEEGLVADLKAMGELGVGTAHIFAPSMGDLPVKAKPMDAEWLRLFAVAIREAKKHGLTLGFHNCPGWSSSGGPWIAPENSMKKVVWRETDAVVRGGVVADAPALAPPTANLGFYRDIAVFAFPCAGAAPAAVASATTALPRALGTATPGVSATLDFAFAAAWRPRFFLFRTDRDRVSGVLRVEAEADGAWREIGRLEISPWTAVAGDRIVRLNLPKAAASFRATFTSHAFPDWMGQHDTVVTAASFTAQPLIANVAEMNSSTCFYGRHTAENPAEPGLDPESVIDVTAALHPDGTFDWASTPIVRRDGRWRLLRIGYTSTGARPGPATIDGLECDKLDRRGIESHWAAMPAKILALPGAKGTVSHCVIDSYEVGGQNWTEILPTEFERRRGYPLGKHLVTVCGYALGTTGDSLKFLWDWQLTIGELFAENYYDRFAELCRAAGVNSVIEPYGGPFDGLRCGRGADVPTGEFWLGRECYSSPRMASSLAHLHGRRHAATESFTTDEEEGRWSCVPHKLRVAGDERGWLNGINQLVFHSYVHQPFPNARPGISLGRHGSQFNRNTTWWTEGRLWADYVRRGQALLQYGEPVAEFLVMGGPPADELMRRGWNYDFCSPDDLELLTVQDGRLNARYAALILREDEARFTPRQASKLAAMERAGAKVFRGLSPVDAACALGLPPPFDGRGQLQTTRRRSALGETVWLVVNVSDRPFDGEAGFAAEKGTSPERFDAKTGGIGPLAWRRDGDFIRARLRLNPHESTFVVFSAHAAALEADAQTRLSPQPADASVSLDISDGWTLVAFAGPNAPTAPLDLPQLRSWSESNDPRLRYFSGRAVYEKTVGIDVLGCPQPSQVLLDLGEVHDIANVWINHTFIGTLWEPPFCVDITDALTTSNLNLRIEVVNCWPNRMIGDAIARANGAAETKVEGKWPRWVLENRRDSGTGVYTWSNWGEAFRPDETLLKAGLLGPVTLRRGGAAPGS